ncbi:MAG: Fic family protein [Ignavibacteria bacterium]|nr:Fic family protein [Ignavibacteria bacterium]
MKNFIEEIEPTFPLTGQKELEEKCLKVVSLSGGLGNNLSSVTLSEISSLVVNMNSYYSNLIEGNKTTPADIERVMLNKLSKDPFLRSKEYEHKAHIEVQRLIEGLLFSDKNFDICTVDFICSIHREFYERIPKEFRRIKDPGGNMIELIPGELRKFDVKVGSHIPPSFEMISEFLEKFCSSYKLDEYSGINKLIAAGASHHRLSWVHPFPDGNGRTSRLFTHAYLIKAGINSKNLWSISRGFARNLSSYYSMLSNADETRLNDFDGRGNLSDKRLSEFCDYFLNLTIDQIEFMASLFEFDNILKRIKKYVESNIDLKPESFLILKETFISGILKRGEVLALTGLPERTARRELRKLLDLGLLKSDTPKGPLKAGFPVYVLEYYFPRLYPNT